MSNVRLHLKPTESVAAFEAYVEAAGSSLPEILPGLGIAKVLSFFETITAQGCKGPSQDMLLFEWGTYDWGNGKFFELSISRQFVEQGLEGEPEISQLRLVFKYPSSSQLGALGEGNRWCKSRAELREFEKFIHESAAYQGLARKEPPGVSLSHSYV